MLSTSTVCFFYNAFKFILLARTHPHTHTHTKMIPLEVSLVQLAQIEKDRKSKRKRVRDEMLFPKFGPQDKGEACLIFIYPPVADWRGSL